jgi:hypothetical protein
MKLLDVFRIMNEAPIRDFDVQPSATTPDKNTWGDRDKQKLASPSFEKLARKKIKTGIPIDVTIIGMPQVDDEEYPYADPSFNWMSGRTMGQEFIHMLDNYSGVVEADKFTELTGTTVVPAPNAITAVFMSNTNDVSSAMPVSPWILCHRLSHSIFDAASNKQLGEMARQNAYPFINVPFEWLTMNSAKPGKQMANGGEIGVELMAQFLHDGKITLARVDENKTLELGMQEMGVLTNGHTVYGDTGGDDEIPMEDLTLHLEDKESQLNISAGILVNACLGKLVVAP